MYQLYSLSKQEQWSSPNTRGQARHSRLNFPAAIKRGDTAGFKLYQIHLTGNKWESQILNQLRKWAFYPVSRFFGPFWQIFMDQKNVENLHDQIYFVTSNMTANNVFWACAFYRHMSSTLPWPRNTFQLNRESSRSMRPGRWNKFLFDDLSVSVLKRYSLLSRVPL